MNFTPEQFAAAEAKADAAVAAMDAAGDAFAAATDLETELSDGRSIEKSAAIIRLMSVVNPETQKNHSASSAEKVVEADSEFLAYRKRERAAVVARIKAEAAYQAATRRADLAIGLAMGGL